MLVRTKGDFIGADDVPSSHIVVVTVLSIHNAALFDDDALVSLTVPGVDTGTVVKVVFGASKVEPAILDVFEYMPLLVGGVDAKDCDVESVVEERRKLCQTPHSSDVLLDCAKPRINVRLKTRIGARIMVIKRRPARARDSRNWRLPKQCLFGDIFVGVHH